MKPNGHIRLVGGTLLSLVSLWWAIALCFQLGVDWTASLFSFSETAAEVPALIARQHLLLLLIGAAVGAKIAADGMAAQTQLRDGSERAKGFLAENWRPAVACFTILALAVLTATVF